MTGRFAARVDIPPSEFERLETGRYEKPDRVTPFVVYLHEKVGRWGTDWYIDHDPLHLEGGECVYFACPNDAVYFLLRWSP